MMQRSSILTVVLGASMAVGFTGCASSPSPSQWEEPEHSIRRGHFKPRELAEPPSSRSDTTETTSSPSWVSPSGATAAGGRAGVAGKIIHPLLLHQAVNPDQTARHLVLLQVGSRHRARRHRDRPQVGSRHRARRHRNRPQVGSHHRTRRHRDRLQVNSRQRIRRRRDHLQVVGSQRRAASRRVQRKVISHRLAVTPRARSLPVARSLSQIPQRSLAHRQAAGVCPLTVVRLTH